MCENESKMGGEETICINALEKILLELHVIEGSTHLEHAHRDRDAEEQHNRNENQKESAQR